jgi:hypothetical protein
MRCIGYQTHFPPPLQYVDYLLEILRLLEHSHAAMRHLKLLLLAAAFAGAPMLSHAQTYDISWYVIAGGGGTSSGGVYTISGTIGQADAGHMAGGSYTLDGGFWGIFAAVQTPGSPLLTVKAAFPNVVISWPVSTSTFTLQQNGNLTTSNWANVGQSVVVTNGSNTVTVPAAGNAYFRLKF